jgi:cyclopropane-fatty-acyl-phospholipid synthase
MSEPLEQVADAPGDLAPPVGGWLARRLRGLVRRRVEGLAGGQLTVVDPWGVWSAGEPGALDAALEVADPGLYRALVLGGTVAAERAYLEGRWRSPDLTRLLRLMIANGARTAALDRGPAGLVAALSGWRQRLRRHDRPGSRANVAAHYDLGNDLFALFLDPTLTYSAAIFDPPDSSLEQASVAKLDRVCRKLELQPGDHLLEIGTGWGSLALHAAGRYGCRVTTTTLSREQHELASRRVAEAGLADRVSVLLRDYRDLEGRFDKLASIEMIEAVGHAGLPTFFARCAERLAPDGRMVLQTITMPDRGYARYLAGTDFIRLHVFPGGTLPSLGAMLAAIARETRLRVVHVEDIGPHYATTLRLWRKAFLARADEVRRLGYPERFLRLWEYYLCYCEAGFEERYLGDLQLVLDGPDRRSPSLLGDLRAPGGVGDRGSPLAAPETAGHGLPSPR